MRLPFASLPLALSLIFLAAPAAAQEGGALSPRVVEEAAVPRVSRALGAREWWVWECQG